MNDNLAYGAFSEVDRKTLIELSVDMGYMKRGIDKLSHDLSESAAATKTELKDIWDAIEELRKFRWWLAGAVCGSGAVGGALVKLILH